MQTTMINKEIIAAKRKYRMDKILAIIGDDKSKFMETAIWLDSTAPATTNRKMLADVGFSLQTVTETNWRDWLNGLSEIGVKVIEYEELSDSEIVFNLNHILDEQLPECWGGEDMQEYISFGSD